MNNTVAIIGAGQMGSGIAQTVAANGIDVLLADVSLEVAEQAHAGIDKALGKLVGKGKIEIADAEATLKRITPVADYAPMQDASLIIEAATEKEAIKQAIFEKAGQYLAADAIMASNTSSIPITRMANYAPDPARFIGLHFFNPVPVMKLIEVIPGLATAQATTDSTTAFAESLGKEVVLSQDEPGFVVNRILLPMINEAIYVLYEGVGSVESIDTAMKLGANHPMGPLQLADFIGLDTCLSIMQVLHDGLADSKYRPCPLLVKYVEAGWLGRKTGRGFYDYTGEEPVPTR